MDWVTLGREKLVSWFVLVGIVDIAAKCTSSELK